MERGSSRSRAEPRALAARVVARVDRDRAFLAAALDAELERAPDLEPRDRALATELSYGAVQCRGALLERLTALAPRGLPRDARVVAQLLVAAYQLLVLDRVPAHAAVGAAVEGVRAVQGPRVAGFVNALLRRLSSEGARLSRAEAIVRSAPPWLREALASEVGVDEARALLGAREDDESVGAGVAVRVVSGRALPPWLAGSPPGRLSLRARRVPRAGDLRTREGWDEGVFVVQEEGAQVVALALGARAGERVLDACAGRGQKTSLFSEQVGRGGAVVAVDVHPAKLEALAAEHARLGLPRPTLAAVDLTRGTAELPTGFDRALVDAPCSGTGTLGRRPDVTLRLDPGDPARLGAQAAVILRNAAGLVRPGGRVVYAVCSVLRAECEEVVAAVGDLLVPAPFDAPELAPELFEGTSSFRLLPGAHGTDGFFVASFVRRA